MQRLLLIVALLAMAACASDEIARTDGSEDAPPILRETRLPLHTQRVGSQSNERHGTFATRSIQGSLDGSGSWSLRAEIDHPRLRCATYAPGVRVGRGDIACENVQWLTAPQFGRDRRQCNQATLVHTANGRFDLPPGATDSINCVGIVLRCSGAC
jgi:hypothetical protein